MGCVLTDVNELHIKKYKPKCPSYLSPTFSVCFLSDSETLGIVNICPFCYNFVTLTAFPSIRAAHITFSINRCTIIYKFIWIKQSCITMHSFTKWCFYFSSKTFFTNTFLTFVTCWCKLFSLKISTFIIDAFLIFRKWR